MIIKELAKFTLRNEIAAFKEKAGQTEIDRVRLQRKYKEIEAQKEELEIAYISRGIELDSVKQENERLKQGIEVSHKPIAFSNYTAIQVCASSVVTDFCEEEIEDAKNEIKYNLINEINPFIEWYIEDKQQGKTITANLWIYKKEV